MNGFTYLKVSVLHTAWPKSDTVQVAEARDVTCSKLSRQSFPQTPCFRTIRYPGKRGDGLGFPMYMIRFWNRFLHVYSKSHSMFSFQEKNVFQFKNYWRIEWESLKPFLSSASKEKSRQKQKQYIHQTKQPLPTKQPINSRSLPSPW